MTMIMLSSSLLLHQFLSFSSWFFPSFVLPFCLWFFLFLLNSQIPRSSPVCTTQSLQRWCTCILLFSIFSGNSMRREENQTEYFITHCITYSVLRFEFLRNKKNSTANSVFYSRFFSFAFRSQYFFRDIILIIGRPTKKNILNLIRSSV